MSRKLEEPAISVIDAAKILGLSRSGAYRAVKEGNFPVQVIRVGRRLIVPTSPLRRLLGLEDPKSA